MNKIPMGSPFITIEDKFIKFKKPTPKKNDGNKIVGWKMRLISFSEQQSVGVNQPIYGSLIKSMEN